MSMICSQLHAYANSVGNVQDYSNRMGGFRNLFHNPTFVINQRCVSGTVYLTPGQYGHDGLRAEYTQTRPISVLSSINAALLIMLYNHGFAQNQPIVFSTNNALPDPLVAGRVYYVYQNDQNTFYVRNAPNGSQITMTSVGTGNHSVTPGACYTFANTYTNSAEQTIVITGGTLSMPVEVNKLIHGGIYFLHHEGTASIALHHNSNTNPQFVSSNPGTSIVANTSNGSLIASFSNGTIIRPQLEYCRFGASSTPFEYRPLSIDQYLCQRYYQKSYSQNVIHGSAYSNGTGSIIVFGAMCFIRYPVSMANDTPSLTVYDGTGTSGRVDAFINSQGWIHGCIPQILKSNEKGFSLSAIVDYINLEYTVSAEVGQS